MITPVEVVNLALARLSLDPIVSLDENSDRSKRAKPIWAISLHLFLNEAEWSFARRTVTPPRVQAEADMIGRFKYAYALPEDCLKLTAVHGKAFSMWYRDPDYEVAKYDDLRRQAILSSAKTIRIEYITNRVNLSDMPPEAIDAIACRVAAEIALSKQNSSQRANELMQLYEMALAKAKKNDVKKEPPRRNMGHDYTRVRL